MWYSTVTPTDPDMRRVSWGQSALTTTREVSFALSLVDTHELRRVLNNTEVKERNSTICRHAHVSAFHASSVQLWYMLERDDHRTYTHESALTRRMWYSTVTPTDPDMRRVSWGQSALTTTREVSFALSLVDIYIYICIYIVQSADMRMFRRSTPRQCSFGTCWNVMMTVLIHMNLLSPDACGTAQ